MSRYATHYKTSVNGQDVLVPELPAYLLEAEADFVEDNETPVETGTTWDGIALRSGAQEDKWYLFYGLNFLRAPDPLAIPEQTHILLPAGQAARDLTREA